jgi:broad specificity phosphatase PhoE
MKRMNVDMPVKRPRLRLLRHGQASLGSADYDRLSELGQTQSRLLGQRISGVAAPEHVLWSGSMRRHRQTLEYLSIDAPCRVEEGLNEYTVSELIRSAMVQAEQIGLNLPDTVIFEDPVTHLKTLLGWFPEVLVAWQQARFECHHNGSWQSFRERVTAQSPDWQVAMEQGRDVTVVTSAGVISTVVADLLNESLGWQRELNVALYNASVTELALEENGSWTAITVNCTRHLDSASLQTLA